MKKQQPYLICFILALLSNINVQADSVDIDVDNLRYTIDTETNTAEVYGPVSYSTTINNLVIPDYIEYNSTQIPVISIRDYAFFQCSGFTGSLTIGNSVQTIGKGAFSSCSRFTGSLIIGNSVQTIGEGAFQICSGFTGSLTIPNSVQTIGDNAFFQCSGFTGSLTIGDSVKTIGVRAFWHCEGFMGSLTIGNSVQTIGVRAFEDCKGFTGSLTIPNSVQTIGEGAFSGCSGLTGSLTIPNSIQTIGDFVFTECSGFTGSLTIPNSVQIIGEGAFSSCSGFSGSLIIGNSVQIIGDHAFQICSGFTGSLTIPNSVQTIGEGAFSGCKGLTGSLTIGNSVQIIGERAFSGCSGFIGSLTIGNSVQTIGEGAFQNCSGFTGSLIIPNSVETIGYFAFDYCNSFTSLIIGKNVKTIGDDNYGYAFNCGGLEYITCLAKIPPTAYNANFNYYNYQRPLYVPAESIDAYKTAFDWKDFQYINPLQIEATEITLNKTELSLMIGQEETLIATLTPEDSSIEIVWSVETGGENIVSVSQEGKVTALSVGTATVIATTGSVSASCKVTVNPITATGIELNIDNMTLLVGQTDKLKATVTPPNTTDQSVTWKSDNEAVATVDADGTVTGVSVGVALITATCGEASATCKVSVKAQEGIFGTAETPLELLRKGNGTSCTFITMMPISDSQMESQGYKLVYGYDNPTATLVLDNTTLRYTHTTSAIYNDPANDFWVFAYYVDGNGDLCVSYRRHLDGRVDDDFDPLVLISSPVRNIEDEIIGIYTIEGRYVGKDIDSLGHGVYIVKTATSSTKIVK